MAETVLLTGATGFLGTEVADRLIRHPNLTIYALVRAADEAEAAHRLRSVWHDHRELCSQIGKQVIPASGDFTKPGLGLEGEISGKITESVTLVVHAGAEINFNKSKDELFEVNVSGTKNMLSFAADMKSLRRFVHISTAYVAGQKRGLVMEEDGPAQEFSGFYEQSKAEAEKLVRESGLPYTICRPGMIIGDSKSGRVRNFNTIYYVLKMMLLGKMRIFPMKPQTLLNLVPVDYVADAVEDVCFAGEADGKTVHLTCPKEAAPSAGELADYVRKWACENLSVDLPKPVFMPIPALKQAGISHNRKTSEQKKGYLNNYLTLLPYFFAQQEFDRTNADRLCRPFQIAWRDYMDPMLEFACRKNFMRQTGQTVFEQAMVRRESTRYPINYYDIREDGIYRVSGPAANRRIEKILDALWAWGIRKGDRIALTGINSTAYMTLEQALGLIGAVSVPIYYTTPAKETSLLLEKSGAKWFFIGDTRMMTQLEELETEAKLVSFSIGEKIRHKRVMRWKKFLSAAAGPTQIEPPESEDLATIRYTSGTTGEPKGVMFQFGQLAWMGEIMINLLTWEDRNRPMRYLSFLPLSHVVEGILASYAPYYVLTKVDYYYLNDFGSLTDALPKVRPTVFFSVPRFYEKVWDRVNENRIGQAYLAAKDGPVKQAMGKVLRKAVLKKAGIDQCSQLIVGSAPISEALLMNFRKLGIEIHNAYGQTEAPLITINRMGDNVIPTIGTPLPETSVTAEEDGELIVRGPQVTIGYYGLQTENIQDGVLRTGDLGIIHENGHITLIGRKKDMIITAYGKNISIPKIEERLKNIAGVSEAVLIGENRPYCTALLWTEGDIPDLETLIEEVNAGLSHPEQIRKFKVIPRALSIAEGELTPNLKVKRGAVEEHFAKEIEEMYA